MKNQTPDYPMAHIQKILGKPVKDKVTGFEGVATSVGFDLYGCVTAWVTPKHTPEKTDNGGWYDVSRLKIIKNKPIMEVPDFHYGVVSRGEKGAAIKGAPLK